MTDFKLPARCLCLDLEVHPRTNRILKIGAVRLDTQETLHLRGKFNLPQALRQLERMAHDAEFLLGHNLLAHDLPVLAAAKPDLSLLKLPALDTLLLSPLAFPQNPYHRLIKDYKVVRDSVNDPLADARLTHELLLEQQESFKALGETAPEVLACYHYLLASGPHGAAADLLLASIRQRPRPRRSEVEQYLADLMRDRVCASHLRRLLTRGLDKPNLNLPIAYTLAWLRVSGGNSVIPPWVRHQFPDTRVVVRLLREVPCGDPGCRYCAAVHNAQMQLKKFFGFESFRPSPANERGGSLQADITAAGMRGEPLLAVLPTSGGKSVCYQLPALARYWRNGSLTIIISPLQSLMKDQVDGLYRQGIYSAAAFNSLLTMPERKDVLDKICLGDIGLLLVSPEQMRNRSLKQAIRQREIGAWVFDEAHCLSKWGHDFRVDYLYVARVIKELAQGQAMPHVSCFTATGKRDVLEEIQAHFHEVLGIQLTLFDGGHERNNLTYAVIPIEPGEKLSRIHDLLETQLPADGGAIVFSATQKGAEEIAEYLKMRKWRCDHYHAGVQPELKKQVQQRFLDNELQVIVATNAFGMGVDKPNVRTVIHAELPGSPENYLQEAGRAGRDGAPATCLLLFNPDDVETQFGLAARSRVTRKDCVQVWRRLLRMSKRRRDGPIVVTSGEVLADADLNMDIDAASPDANTKVRTIIAWLEKAGLLLRDENLTRVFPACLKVRSLDEAARRVDKAGLSAEKRQQFLAVVSHLMNARPDDGVNTDELMVLLGLPGEVVVRILQQLEELGVLENDMRLTAYLARGVDPDAATRLARAREMELALLDVMRENAPAGDQRDWQALGLQRMGQAVRDRIGRMARPDQILRLLNTLRLDQASGGTGRGSLEIQQIRKGTYRVRLTRPWASLRETAKRRHATAACVLRFLMDRLPAGIAGTDLMVSATIGELAATIAADPELAAVLRDRLAALERALLYMHEQEVLTLNRGMAVFRTAMTIRVNRKGQRRFEHSDYEPLHMHYAERVFQIHVMHEYARLALIDVGQALGLMDAYFHRPRAAFIERYFSGRPEIVEMATTHESWQRIVGSLNHPVQAKVVSEHRDVNRIVLSGPGAGKTRVIVHRVAYLLRVARVPAHGVLVLTFNRRAALEVRRRLFDLVGNDACGVGVMTYHALAMRLTGRSFSGWAGGDAEPDFDAVMREAAALLNGTTADGLPPDEFRDRLLQGFRYILVDEYQDINSDQYDLISGLAGRACRNEDQKMTILAVGDDDQNVYAWRNSDVGFIRRFQADYQAEVEYLVENFRSSGHIIDAANAVIARNPDRMKADHPVRINDARAELPPGGEWQRIDAAVGQGRVQILRIPNEPLTQAHLAMMELDRLRRLAPDWDWGQCAVLAREHKFLDPVRAWCELHNVPYWCQEDGQRGVPFHQVREVVRFLEACEALPEGIADGEQLRMLWQQLYAGEVENEWLRLLKQGIDVYLSDTASAPMPVAHLIEWLYEYGLAVQRGMPGRLSLMTVHAAKGLEFDHVVILDGGWESSTDTAGERRLFYVGMTRARQMLALCRFEGGGNPFIRPLFDENSVLVRTVLPPAAIDPRLGRGYRALNLGEVDLGYVGRHATEDAVHAAIARLRPGDPITLECRDGRWYLQDGTGRDIGRTKAGVIFREGRIESACVSVILRRHQSQTQDPVWRAKCQVPVWDVVLCDVVIGPLIEANDHGQLPGIAAGQD